jgi:hypothetical protein
MDFGESFGVFSLEGARWWADGWMTGKLKTWEAEILKTL